MNVPGDARADEVRDSIGTGHPVSAAGEGTQESRSATWLARLALSAFTGMGSVSELPLPRGLAQPGLAQGPSDAVHTPLSQMDASAKDPRRRWSPLPTAPPKPQLVFRTAPCSLAGPPVVRPLMPVAATEPGQGGHFHQQPPNNDRGDLARPVEATGRGTSPVLL